MGKNPSPLEKKVHVKFKPRENKGYHIQKAISSSGENIGRWSLKCVEF